MGRRVTTRKSVLSRRGFFSFAGMGGLGVVFAACATAAQPVAETRSGMNAASTTGAIAVNTGQNAAAQMNVPTSEPPTVAVPATIEPAPPTATTTLLNTVAPAPSPTLAPVATPVIVPPTAVPTQVPTPTVLAFDVGRLKDNLAGAQTSYAGSVAERAWNVELATKRLDGTRIAPGEVFSFNAAVGATTLKAGYKIGYGIIINGDKPETIPSVAGGICQVATTVFQAAFWAGLPFVERHYHLYWIPRYGQAPSGRVGLDATVDDPGVDLKFKNTTGNWIYLDSWYDGANIGFSIKGIDPGWDVEASKPKTFDFVKAEQAMVRQNEPSIPYGKEVYVEHAEDGFRLTANRTVTFKGKVLDDYTFTNYYRPSRNVTLVGTQGAPPPKPTVAPPVESPVATVTKPVVAATTPSPDAPPAVAKPVNGQVKVPSLVGLSEAQARQNVEQSGLANTYPNYQGPGQVPDAALKAVPVGSVLSQTPQPGAMAPTGTTVFLAVRKG